MTAPHRPWRGVVARRLRRRIVFRLTAIAAIASIATGAITLGPRVKLTLHMGDDGVFSGGLVVVIDVNCTPPTTTPPTTVAPPVTVPPVPAIGIVKDGPVLDLDYPEDSTAETDLNVVMNDGGGFIELQGTAEGHAFRRNELDDMLVLAEKGIRELMQLQEDVLNA